MRTDEPVHPLAARTEVDHDSLRSNLDRLSVLAAGATLLVPVKADAYGHGLVEVARTIERHGPHRLGVARLAEACRLRKAGLQLDIHLLEPLHPMQVDVVIDLELVATIDTIEAARALARGRVRSASHPRAHIKIDTGMSRLGMRWDNREAVREVLEVGGINWEGMFTHLARAESDSAATALQIERFDGLCGFLQELGCRPPLRHAFNSAALFTCLPTGHDLVRPGLATYGYDPLAPHRSVDGLRPSLRLVAPIRGLRTVYTGESVSYGSRWTARRTSRIAVLPLGYGDGFPRALSGRFEVLVRGVRCPQVGTICMDLMMIDVTDAPIDLALGEDVDVVPRIPGAIEALAEAAGTIPYELTCLLGLRLPRVHLGVREPCFANPDEDGAIVGL